MRLPSYTSTDEAKRLAATLLVHTDKLSLYAVVENGRIIFDGGRFGAHSLALSCSTEARIRAHWDGYLQANGLT